MNFNNDNIIIVIIIYFFMNITVIIINSIVNLDYIFSIIIKNKTPITEKITK